MSNNLPHVLMLPPRWKVKGCLTCYHKQTMQVIIENDYAFAPDPVTDSGDEYDFDDDRFHFWDSEYDRESEMHTCPSPKRKRKQSKREKHRLWACKTPEAAVLNSLGTKACVWSGSQVSIVCFTDPIRRDNILRTAALCELHCLEAFSKRNPLSWHSNSAGELGFLAETMPQSFNIHDFIRAISEPLGPGEDFQPQRFEQLRKRASKEVVLNPEEWTHIAHTARIIAPNTKPSVLVSKQCTRSFLPTPFRKMNQQQKRKYWTARKRFQRSVGLQRSERYSNSGSRRYGDSYLAECVMQGYKSDDFAELEDGDVHYLRSEFGYKLTDYDWWLTILSQVQFRPN